MSKELNKRMTFVGNTIIKDQRVTEAARDNSSKSLLDRLNEDLKQKDSVIDYLNMQNVENKAKIDELLRENLTLKEKKSQINPKTPNVSIERQRNEVTQYVSNELYLKEEKSHLERQLKSLLKENFSIKERFKEKTREMKQSMPDLRSIILEVTKETKEQINKASIFFKTSLQSLEETFRCNLEKNKLEKQRLLTSLEVRSREISFLSADNQSKSLRLKELEEQVSSYSKSLSQVSLKYSQLEKEFLQSSNNKERVSFNKYQKLDEEYQAHKEKFNALQSQHKSFIEYVKTNQVLILSLFSATPSAGDLFSQITESLKNLLSKFASLEVNSQSLAKQISDLKLQISYLESQNTFKLTQSHDLESEITSLTEKLKTQSAEIQLKDHQISVSELRIQRFQSEIKVSFDKIENLKSQLSEYEKNLVMIRQLQDLLEYEKASNRFLTDQINALKKKVSELELRNVQPSDPNSFLLSKIEYMKNELESYCPNETKSKNPGPKQSLFSSFQVPMNKLNFSLKVLEDDYCCKKCKKTEDLEVCQNGHLICVICDKICGQCQSHHLNSSIFFRFSRRIRDLNMAVKELNELISVVS